MDKSRASVTEIADRAAAAERRGLLDVDQERQARAKSEKALEGVRAQAAQTEERLRSDIQALSETNARLASKVDTLEAANRQTSAKLEENVATAEGLREQLRLSQDEAARAKTEAHTLQTVIQQLSPVPPSPAAARAPRTRKT